MPIERNAFEQLSDEKPESGGIKVDWPKFWEWFNAQEQGYTIGELRDKILADFIIDTYREAAAKLGKQPGMYYSEIYSRLTAKIRADKVVKGYDGKTAYYAPVSVTKRKP